jgi:hypothetical protein
MNVALLVLFTGVGQEPVDGSLTGPVGNFTLAYCIGGPDDPSQTVSVNPFVGAS